MFTEFNSNRFQFCYPLTLHNFTIFSQFAITVLRSAQPARLITAQDRIVLSAVAIQAEGGLQGRVRSMGQTGKRLTASHGWATAPTLGLSQGISRAASSGTLRCNLVDGGVRLYWINRVKSQKFTYIFELEEEENNKNLNEMKNKNKRELKSWISFSGTTIRCKSGRSCLVWGTIIW